MCTRLAIVLTAMCLLVGCGSDKKRAPGRIRSVSASPANEETTALQLRLLREREEATGAETWLLEARLDTEAQPGAALLLPDQSQVPLEKAGNLLLALRQVGSQDEADRVLGAGSFTAVWRELGGTRHAVTRQMVGGFQPYPQITSPAEMALVSPDLVHVSWDWDGTATLFDVSVTNTASGALVAELTDQPGPDLDLPPLEASAHYRLKITAGSAPHTASARWESAALVVFDTTSGGAQ